MIARRCRATARQIEQREERDARSHVARFADAMRDSREC